MYILALRGSCFHMFGLKESFKKTSKEKNELYKSWVLRSETWGSTKLGAPS